MGILSTISDSLMTYSYSRPYAQENRRTQMLQELPDESRRMGLKMNNRKDKGDGYRQHPNQCFDRTCTSLCLHILFVGLSLQDYSNLLPMKFKELFDSYHMLHSSVIHLQGI